MLHVCVTRDRKSKGNTRYDSSVLCPKIHDEQTHMKKNMKIKLRLSLTSQKVQKIKFACLSCFSTMSHLFQMETFLKQIFSVTSVTGQVDKTVVWQSKGAEKRFCTVRQEMKMGRKIVVVSVVAHCVNVSIFEWSLEENEYKSELCHCLLTDWSIHVPYPISYLIYLFITHLYITMNL